MFSARKWQSGLVLVPALFFTVGCSGDGPVLSAFDAGRGTDASASRADADPEAPQADAEPGAPDATLATGCTADALELITLVNEYRAENALPAIAASSSLCIVGDTHIGDLVANSPHSPASCNMHSWSDQGSWSACCYTSDHAQAQCMWDKPKQLTVYPSNGYENAAGGGGSISPLQALNLWKGSPGHNAVILNEGIWANQEWRAMGQAYAMATRCCGSVLRWTRPTRKAARIIPSGLLVLRLCV